MVSILVLLAEVVFCAFLLYVIKKYFKESIGKIATAVLVVMLTVALFLVNSWVQQVPVIHDKVKVTAMNEKNPLSQGKEFSVQGITTPYGKQDFPKVVSGKWFFTTDSNYMWRPKWDKRQPEGTTKKITLKIPVGSERTLLVRRSDWGGLAKIKCCEQENIVDSFTTNRILLANSSLKRQLFQAAVRLLLFGIIMCAFVALLYVFARIYQSDDDKLKSKSTYGLIALGFLLLTFPYLESQEFWLDEMFQIGFSGAGKNLFETLMVTETTPPLFRLIANVWYNIMPYGEEWLLLLPTLFCAGLIYIVGLLGEEVGGKYVGYTSAILAAVSTALLNSGAREFRANSLLAFLSSVLILYYIKNLKTGKHKVTFTLCMLLLAYTHYFGVFLCGAVFILDIYYFFIKKKTYKDFIPYVIVFALYIPWILRFLSLGQISFEAFWQPIPSLKEIYNLLLYLCGDLITVILLGLGILSIFVICKAKKDEVYNSLPLVLIQFIMVLCVYAYGTFVRPQATLWTERYFLNIIPCVIVVMAYALVVIGKFLIKIINKSIENKQIVKTVKKVICVLLPVLFLVLNFQQISADYVKPVKTDYKGAANTIYSHADAYKDDSLVVMVCQGYVVDGWYDYYMTMQGKRDGLNYVSIDNLPTPKEADEFFEKYNTIYMCYLQDYGSSVVNEQLESNYELIDDNTSTCVRVYKRKSAVGENLNEKDVFNNYSNIQK